MTLLRSKGLNILFHNLYSDLSIMGSSKIASSYKSPIGQLTLCNVTLLSCPVHLWYQWRMLLFSCNLWAYNYREWNMLHYSTSVRNFLPWVVKYDLRADVSALLLDFLQPLYDDWERWTFAWIHVPALFYQSEDKMSESTSVEHAFALCYLDLWNNTIQRWWLIYTSYMFNLCNSTLEIKIKLRANITQYENWQLTTELVTLTLSFHVGMTQRWSPDVACL